MRVLRRFPAALVLLLQFAVGARPLVGVSQPANASAGHHAVVAVIPDCHTSATDPATAPDAVTPDHSMHAEHAASSEPAPSTTQPSGDQPAGDHDSHHDAGCHGAPCCAPVVPGHVIRAITIRDIPIDRLRPSTGAARIVFSDGARRRPPSTAPPVA